MPEPRIHLELHCSIGHQTQPRRALYLISGLLHVQVLFSDRSPLSKGCVFLWDLLFTVYEQSLCLSSSILFNKTKSLQLPTHGFVMPKCPYTMISQSVGI